MLTTISYIWPISSQNTEAIHMGKDSYDSALSCPEDKCPLMRAAVQSRRKTVDCQHWKEPQGRAKDWRQPSEVLLLLHWVESEVFRATYHKIKVTCRNEYGKEDGRSRSTDMERGKWDQWAGTKTFLKGCWGRARGRQSQESKGEKICDVFSCIFSE